MYEIFWLLNSSNKPVLSSGLEILSGLAQEDATKSVATTQVIADSTEISVEDRQEVEESKEETEDMTMNTATEDLFLGQVLCFTFEI